MINKKLANPLLHEEELNKVDDYLNIVVDRLLHAMKEDDSGIYWETLEFKNEKASYTVSDNLYNGTGGILLFLIECYKINSEEKYLALLTKGAAWLSKFARSEQQPYYAFYTGSMGVAYILYELGEVLEEEKYKKQALEMAYKSKISLQNPNRTDDLLNGNAGILLALLLLHEKSQDELLIPIIKDFITSLLQFAEFGKQGLYWDRDEGQIHGLCGYSHGACGVGAVFLELAKYFDHPSFYHIAHQSFLYESQFYDQEYQNWADLRKFKFSDQDNIDFKQAFEAKNMAFFTQPNQMHAWCHGAPGVGFSRMRASELFGHDIDKEHWQQAIDGTLKSFVFANDSTHTLCHGNGGNATLITSSALLQSNRSLVEPSLHVADQLMKQYDKLGYFVCGFPMLKDKEDTSLFMGNAGIGYFLLHLLYPNSVNNIEGLKINKVASDQLCQEIKEAFSEQKMATLLAKKLFPRTMHQVSEHQESPKFKLEDQLMKGVADQIYELNIDPINDLLAYEQELISFDHTSFSNTFVGFQYNYLSEKNSAMLELEEEEILGKTFNLVPTIKLMEAKHNWVEQWNNLKNMEPQTILLVQRDRGVEDIPINDFTEVIIELLQADDQPLNAIVSKLFEMFEVDSQEEVAQVKSAFVNQIKEFIKAGFLEEVK